MVLIQVSEMPMGRRGLYWDKAHVDDIRIIVRSGFRANLGGGTSPLTPHIVPKPSQRLAPANSRVGVSGKSEVARYNRSEDRIVRDLFGKMQAVVQSQTVNNR